MNRSPLDMLIKKYTESIYIRNFYPIFNWYPCSKCGNEFRRETIRELSSLILIDTETRLSGLLDIHVGKNKIGLLQSHITMVVISVFQLIIHFINIL